MKRDKIYAEEKRLAKVERREFIKLFSLSICFLLSVFPFSSNENLICMLNLVGNLHRPLAYGMRRKQKGEQ